MAITNSILNKFAKGTSKASTHNTLQNCVIYTRVSTKEQMENNMSLDWQKSKCEAFAKEKGFRIMESFGGTYESAKTDERKEFNRMMAFVKAHKKDKIAYIIVYSLDRFSRTGSSAIHISAELKKTGVNIISITQPIDTSSSSGTFQQNMYFMFSQFDNDMRRQKSVDGMREKLKRGEWLGNCPVGYSYDRNQKEQTIIINEQGQHIKQAFKMRARSCDYNEIIDYLKKA